MILFVLARNTGALIARRGLPEWWYKTVGESSRVSECSFVCSMRFACAFVLFGGWLCGRVSISTAMLMHAYAKHISCVMVHVVMVYR